MKDIIKAPDGYKYEVVDDITVKLVGLDGTKQTTDTKNEDVKVNGNLWAYSKFSTEEQGSNFEGSRLSGHDALLFLTKVDGTWYNQDGVRVSGYLYYKPEDE